MIELEKYQRNVCYCCNLKSGCLIIGTLGWLLTLFQIFYLTSPLKDERHKYVNTQTDIAAEISYSFVTLLLCVLMIYGVYSDNKRFILPWLVLKCMECIAWTIITVILLILICLMKREYIIIIIFFIIVIFTILNWYFWTIVWILYNELPDKDLMTIIPLSEKISKTEENCPIAAV